MHHVVCAAQLRGWILEDIKAVVKIYITGQESRRWELCGGNVVPVDHSIGVCIPRYLHCPDARARGDIGNPQATSIWRGDAGVKQVSRQVGEFKVLTVEPEPL